MLTLAPETASQVTEWREGMRQHLHREGWVEWAEQHQRVEHLLFHQCQVFSERHERGPLIIWEHPAGRCDCNIPEPE